MQGQAAGWVLAAVGLIVWSGCSCSGVPSAAEGPKLDPGEVASAAMTQVDTSGDGQLDEKELAKCPPLLAALSRIDTNEDNKISADEISGRVTAWMASEAALVSGAMRVTLDNEPLEGATVTFVPEPFLGDAYQSCSGTSDASGSVVVEGPDEDNPGMIYLGFYRVEVTGGSKTIPKRYNEQTELGFEAAIDASTDGFDLSSE